MTTDVHQGPLEPVPVATTGPEKKGWRERRWERRRRRIWFEEILGWILVPVIVLAAYYLVDIGLKALGTSPGAVIDGIGALASGL